MPSRSTAVRLSVIETKLDDLKNQNTKEHDMLMKQVIELNKTKADKAVEKQVEDLRKDIYKNRFAQYGSIISVCLAALGFVLGKLLGWL